MEALGDHLRADQDVDFPLSEIAKGVGVGVLAAHVVGVHPFDPRLGKSLDQRVLHFFRAAARVFERRRPALGTRVGHAAGKIAEMAAKFFRAAMERQRDAAIRAHLDIAALRTLERRGITPPVEENDGLLVAVDARVDRLDQAGREKDGGFAFFCGANIEHMRHRHLAFLDTLEQFDQPVLALLRVVVRLERRRGRAKHDRHAFKMTAHNGDVARVIMRRFLLLVGMLVLLVHDDNAEILEGRENGRARRR